MTAQPTGGPPKEPSAEVPPPPSIQPVDPISPSVRAQILATEHWSLLATRSTAQAEVLSRIAILLTFVSATAVSLALVGQATDFDGRFSVFAVVLLCLVLLVGTMTLMRVHNASEEDYALVIGMNRLRAAYSQLDPALASYFVASNRDDEPGVMQTYNYYRANPVTHALGSTGLLVLVVDGAVAGVLTGVIASATGVPTAVTVVLGVFAALVFIAGMLVYPVRRFRRLQREYRPLFPSHEPPGRPEGPRTPGASEPPGR